MKRLNNLLTQLEALSNSSNSVVLTEPYALTIRGGSMNPTTNGTCPNGSNEACNNTSCEGSSNTVCGNVSCFA